MFNVEELKDMIDQQLELQLDTIEAIFRQHIILQVRSNTQDMLSEDGILIISDYTFDQLIFKLAERINDRNGVG